VRLSFVFIHFNFGEVVGQCMCTDLLASSSSSSFFFFF
jgi:hypothetical protein